MYLLFFQLIKLALTSTWVSESCSIVSDSLWPHGLAHQAPLGFSKQVGCLFPSPGYLPDPGIELRSPALQVDSLLSEHEGSPMWGCRVKWFASGWHPTPVLLPEKSHGWRSLVGCGPWGREESDTTERLHFHFSCIGEGNGNPLQCSCLENPRDGGAWWAAVYGVAQSRTRLKWLSSSSKRI